MRRRHQLSGCSRYRLACERLEGRVAADAAAARRRAAAARRLLDMPEGPAVARRRALQRGADLVDRAGVRVADDRAVGADASPSSAAWRRSACVPGGTSPLSTSTPNATRGWSRLSGTVRIALSSSGSVECDPLARDLDIGRFALDPDPAPAEPPRDRAGRAGAEERVEHDVAGLGAGEQDPVEQRLGLLRRMRLRAVLALHPLARRRRSAAASPSASEDRRSAPSSRDN